MPASIFLMLATPSSVPLTCIALSRCPALPPPPPPADNCYFMFDLPGQVELFTMHGSLKAVCKHLADRAHMRLTAVHLVDAHLCTDASK